MLLPDAETTEPISATWRGRCRAHAELTLQRLQIRVTTWPVGQQYIDSVTTTGVSSMVDADCPFEIGPEAGVSVVHQPTKTN